MPSNHKQHMRNGVLACSITSTGMGIEVRTLTTEHDTQMVMGIASKIFKMVHCAWRPVVICANIQYWPDNTS